jgi:thiol:disulfide interchange protein DsbD
MKFPGVVLLVSAAPLAVANPLKVSLIADTTAVVPGTPFALGLRLRHPDGWHTYWKHPGAVGLATSVKWELPPGFRAGEIQWPAPKTVLMSGHLAQGYEGDVLLVIPISPPEKPTRPAVTLTAKVTWMCCGVTCEPAADVPVSLTLPVAETAVPANAALFAASRRQAPQADPAWKSSVSRDGGTIVLTVKPPAPLASPGEIRFFTADGQVDSDRPQPVEPAAGGSFRMILATSEFGPAAAPSLPGVLAIPADGGSRWIGIDPRY